MKDQDNHLSMRQLFEVAKYYFIEDENNKVFSKDDEILIKFINHVIEDNCLECTDNYRKILAWLFSSFPKLNFNEEQLIKMDLKEYFLYCQRNETMSNFNDFSSEDISRNSESSFKHKK